jgi:hypothetical protein
VSAKGEGKAFGSALSGRKAPFERSNQSVKVEDFRHVAHRRVEQVLFTLLEIGCDLRFRVAVFDHIFLIYHNIMSLSVEVFLGGGPLRLTNLFA